jgi:Mg-chelatase subunit ChlD
VLDAPPITYRGGAAAGTTLAGEGDTVSPHSGAGQGFTSEASRTRPLNEVLGERRVDAALHRDATALAARVSLTAPRVRDRHSGSTRTGNARFDGSAGELDLDRTLDLLAERRPFSPDELYVRRPLRHRRSVALLVDVSGSMDGVKARIAAAAVGALAGELRDDELTVIAFWKDVAILRARTTHVDPVALIDELLRIEPRGLTNVCGAIELAARELARSSLERRCIVLLSDCVHNAGPDPRNAARVAPPTHVLLERTGEHDAWLGERIARAGGGRFRSVHSLHDVAPALTALLSP